MHFPMANADNMNLDVYVKHKTINLFSKEKQFIYFISHLLHLNKAATIFFVKILEVIGIQIISEMMECI